MNNLSLYGWNDTLSSHKQTLPFNTLPHGRVVVTHKTCYEVVAEDGFYQCELSGNVLYSRTTDQYPTTGDWVIFQPTNNQKGIILDILPRKKTLYRKKSGTISVLQPIAAHVDKAFIVQGLDANFNPRRAERFIVQALSEEIEPVLILTKADLGFDANKIADALKHLSEKMSVFTTSIYDSATIEQLRSSITEAETIVFLGSSGVGKSSLVNALYGKELLETSSVSDLNGKGRHTSTRREMVLLEQSGVLIDTPGVREFGITSDSSDAIASVLDVADLEKSCRFQNCTHTTEPGCAILEAIINGDLSSEVFQSYLKLQRESSHFSASEHEKRVKGKSFTKMVKRAKNFKANN